ASSARSASTRMRRGRMPIEPSITLMFWSATMKAIPASRISASMKEMMTGSLVRTSSIMEPTLSVPRPVVNLAIPRQFASCRLSGARLEFWRGKGAGAHIGRSIAVGVVVNLGDGKREAPSIKQLIDLTATDMARVNELILARAGSAGELIPDAANHPIPSGGKRLRPLVTLAAARMFGYEGDGHVKLAVSVEFMHTATLLRDDVVDESELRRGRKTARTIWGNQASVLVGDFLLGQAFRMMVDVGSLEALDILSTAASIIAEGEVMQLAAAKNLETTEDEHFAVIKAKTAALFSAAAEVGPVIAGASRAERAAL